jgi:hypothetical protein
MPPTTLRVDTRRSRYDFDSLKHGDSIEVTSVAGAMEMFRRWKKAVKGRRGRLVLSHYRDRDTFNTLRFIDDDIV